MTTKQMCPGETFLCKDGLRRKLLAIELTATPMRAYYRIIRRKEVGYCSLPHFGRMAREKVNR